MTIIAAQIPPEVVEADVLTLDQLRELLDYDPESGVFRWRVARRNGSVPAGTIAGTLKVTGYIRIEINRQFYPAHRLAWFYVNGEWPSSYIDHIDNCRSNNRFSNLRLATNSQNLCNARMPRTNTSGYKGVTWSKKSQRWQAHIKVRSKSLHLGLFDAKEDAHAAVQSARIKYHGAFANDGFPLPTEARDD